MRSIQSVIDEASITFFPEQGLSTMLESLHQMKDKKVIWISENAEYWVSMGKMEMDSEFFHAFCFHAIPTATDKILSMLLLPVALAEKTGQILYNWILEFDAIQMEKKAN